MRIKNKNILVLGFGKTGKALCEFVTKKGGNAFVYDDKNQGIINQITPQQIETQKYDFCVVSPGISLNNQIFAIINQKNIKIMSEIEFASKFSKGKIFAITGTNGKTTTTTFLHHIFETAGKKAYLCGNVGIPFSSVVSSQKKTNYILEVSSFQLETTQHIKLSICAILNLTPDHLDRHGSFEEYIRIKQKITKKCKKIVINRDILHFIQKLSNKNANKYVFSINKNAYCYVENNKIIINKKELCDTKIIKLFGEKNLENILAGITVAYLAKIPLARICDAIKTFEPIEHRCEPCGTFQNIKFINDSKATNIDSTLCALKGDFQHIILLVGGVAKSQNFEQLFLSIKENVDKIFIFGRDGRYIYDEAKKHKAGEICEQKTDMRSAFESAIMFAENIGCGTIVLSPSCASYDEFVSFEHRGKTFKEWVNEFVNNKKTTE